MEFFNTAKAVRLKSHLEKFLVVADEEDERSVRQGRNGSSKKARWTVEMVEGSYHLILLKSCHGGYLTASDQPFLLGITGKMVLQVVVPSPDIKRYRYCMEWEPIKQGYNKVKLRTKGGTYLRANGATPPWRNTITHDLPHRSATQDWVLWDVDVLDDPEHFQTYPSSAYSFSESPSHHHELASDHFFKK